MAEKKKCGKKTEADAEVTNAQTTAEETAEAKVEEKDPLAVENEQLKNQMLSLMAEYDNFKKRTVREKEKLYTDIVGDTVAQLLPVLDNIERALSAVSDKDNEFYKGFELVHKQTKEIFEKIGVKEIVSVGEAFNPDFHNAVMHTEDETAAENMVVEEFQKGYTYKDKVIRYAMVKVAN